MARTVPARPKIHHGLEHDRPKPVAGIALRSFANKASFVKP